MTEIPDLSNSESARSSSIGTGISARDLILILAVIVLWAICYPLVTTGLAAFAPFQFATLRSVLAGSLLLVAGYVFKRPLIPDRGTWLSLIMAALTFTTLGFAGMFLAGGRVTPGLATVIANMQPLVAAFLGYFMLPERLTRSSGLVLGIGFVGIVVIAIPGFTGQTTNSTPLGVGFVVMGAIGVAVGNVILKTIVHRVDPIIAMAWLLLLGAVPLAIAAFSFESIDSMQWTLSSITTLLILSVFGTALAFLGWLDLLRRVDLNVLNTYTFLTPVVAMLLGILFYNEQLVLFEWLGISIVMVAVYLISRTR